MGENRKCLYVEKDSTCDKVTRQILFKTMDDLPDEWVRIQVEYSSLNYKDALCAEGHPGVAKTLPIVPGIDAAGKIVATNTPLFATGDAVMVFHAQFGTECDGGYSTLVDVPAEWVYRIPESLDSRSVMTIGTGGFTAAQCVDELQRHRVLPESGEIIVSGATGGVGIFAIGILAKLGYRVVASTGKPEQVGWLKSLGASEVVGREQLNDETKRPLLAGKWAGAVDTVGGNTLATILRSTRPFGCVTACGLVGGPNFEISVYPFILRGVALQGIDTAGIEREYRQEVWNRIAQDWALERLAELAIEVDLEGLDAKIGEILAGKIAGRVIVKMDS